MKNKHRFMCGLCAAVIACCTASVTISPVPVYADFGELSGISDYLDFAFGEGAMGGASSSPAWALDGFPAYLGALWMADLILNNPLQLGGGLDFQNAVCITGLYSVGGSVRRGFITLADNVTTGADRFVLAESSDFSIALACSPYNGHGGLTGRTYTSTSTSGSTLRTNYDFHNSDGGRIEYDFIFTDGKSFFNDYTRRVSSTSYNFHYAVGISSNVPALSSGESISKYFSSNPSLFMGQGVKPYIPPYSGADLNDYVINVLNPYYLNLYPDIEPYVFAPYSPEFPDPSDVYPGIPRDWTVINPDLPDVEKKHLTLPDFSWSSIDLSGIQEVSHGVGFWWALLGKAFDDFHLMPVTLLVVGLAVVGFVLWKLGG